MSKYFIAKIRYEKTNENGNSKKVTETYLVDALSFTEAEARIIEEITPFITGDFEVSNITPANIAEIAFTEDVSADKWYKCKLEYITVSEKTEAVKRIPSYVLVQASSSRDAVKRFDAHMKGTMADYELVTINETRLMDVFFYGKG